jgi:ABC transporter
MTTRISPTTLRIKEMMRAGSLAVGNGLVLVPAPAKAPIQAPLQGAQKVRRWTLPGGYSRHVPLRRGFSSTAASRARSLCARSSAMSSLSENDKYREDLVTLVGGNGAGKSTLVKLLLRFSDPGTVTPTTTPSIRKNRLNLLAATGPSTQSSPPSSTEDNSPTPNPDAA